MNLQLTTSTNNKSSFDPTPRLESSPVPILFIPFNHKEYSQKYKCKYCKDNLNYFDQVHYCGNCLSKYIKDTTDYKKYLDARFEFTAESYWGIYELYGERYQLNSDSYFKQTIRMNDYYYHYKRDDCKLCGKSDGRRFCSDCYLISSGWVESILTKKKDIPILYLPWWDQCNVCIVCNSKLNFESDCQKWCSNCFIIYTGCRYCLTTNIIFGVTRQSQCKKCERISLIDTIDIDYYKNNIEKIDTNIKEFLVSGHNQIAVYVNNIDKNSDPLGVYDFIQKLNINLSSLKSLVSLYPHVENSIPITFTYFNNNENKCHFCGNKYLETSLYKQKYCKLCLFLYIKYIMDIKYTTNNINVYIYNTSNTFCMKHKSRNSDFYTQNIQEWCVDCSEVLYFKQSITAYSLDKDYYKEQNGIIKSEKDCKLCGKLIFQQISSNDTEFRLCSNCYLVSSGWIESTLTKRLVPILYLQWWDTYGECVVCSTSLESISDCQKWCSYCFIIYIGCRYCLSTNIIFGTAYQSQCRKCKRIHAIDIRIANIFSKEVNMENFLVFTKINANNHEQIANYMNNVGNNSNPLKVYNFIKKLNYISLKPLLLIDYSQTNLTNNENIFNHLNIPIIFISFNGYECYYCGGLYSTTLLFEQKYCERCLFWYIKVTNNTDIIKRMNIHTNTNNNSWCSKEHTLEWCVKCFKVSYFNQIITSHSLDAKYYKGNNKTINSEKDCKLCGQEITSNEFRFRLCSNCYLVSSGWIESISTKKLIPILYLPWRDTCSKCVVCSTSLESISDCQKWCSYCFIIYSGCRDCLTTNIIFGLTNQSQCRKCKKVLFVTIVTATDTASIEFVISKRINIRNYHQIANYMNNIDTNSNPLKVYQFIKNNLKSTKTIMKIEYSQLKTPEQIGIGGFGTIYKASWGETTYRPVAIKRFSNSQNISKDFLNELSSFHQYYNRFEHVIKCYGITQDPTTNEHMIVMEYAEGGDLHNYLQRNFANITWENKLAIILNISRGLESIHNENFIHRDLHSGNILLFPDKPSSKWQIGDLGLSQPADNTLNNNKIYGVIPYIAPEIFDGIKFSKASDVYSMGMIMWELTTGCRPFDNIKHDINLIYKIIDGGRPEITCDTPKCFADLVKRCWDSDPSKRPTVKEIRNTIALWLYKMKDVDQFVQAEKVRLELIKSKKLGPEFAAKSHPGAIYTSRALNSLIPKSSPSTASFNVKEGNGLEVSLKKSDNHNEGYRYISKDQGFDISEDLSTEKENKNIP